MTPALAFLIGTMSGLWIAIMAMVCITNHRRATRPVLLADNHLTRFRP